METRYRKFPRKHFKEGKKFEITVNYFLEKIEKKEKREYNKGER